MTKTIHLQYFAVLREQRGLSAETIMTGVKTARELYAGLQERYHFQLPQDLVKVAINNEFKDWDTALNDKDTIVFIPPVAGG